jgi:hypothetical protein
MIPKILENGGRGGIDRLFDRFSAQSEPSNVRHGKSTKLYFRVEIHSAMLRAFH